VSALFLIEPELFGTNNSGPLSPTKVGDPCCTVPPPAFCDGGNLTVFGTLGAKNPVIAFLTNLLT